MRSLTVLTRLTVLKLGGCVEGKVPRQEQSFWFKVSLRTMQSLMKMMIQGQHCQYWQSALQQPAQQR
jgi:hypothetical protein